MPTDTVLRIARLFKDELTLDNISRPQLVSMCKYMGLQTYGSDTLLRYYYVDSKELVLLVCRSLVFRHT